MLKILTFAIILSVNIFCLGADAPWQTQVERIQEGIYQIFKRRVTIQKLARLSKSPIEISAFDEIKFGDKTFIITSEEINMIEAQNKLSAFISEDIHKDTIEILTKEVAEAEAPLKAIISAIGVRAPYSDQD